MKNYWLAGCAAIALTGNCASASAQTAPGKFDIKISGDAYFEAGFAGTDLESGGSFNTADFTNRFRLVINPEATADNGLSYGAVARIRANNGDGNIDGDRAYLYVSGVFGTVQGGVVNGPSDATYVAAPGDWQMYGLYDQWKGYVPTYKASVGGYDAILQQNGYAWGNWQGNGAAWEGVQLLSSHGYDTKLVYYSPRLFGQTPTTGLQAGISFAPTVGNGANDGSFNTNVNRNGASTSCATTIDGKTYNSAFCGVFQNVYELTANYVETFYGVGVKLGGGYEGGTAKKPTSVDIPYVPVPAGGFDYAGLTSKYNDLQSAQAGLQLSYRDFALGGGYVWGGNSGYNKVLTQSGGLLDRLSQYAWNVGGQYTWGPLVVGLRYAEQAEVAHPFDVYTADHTLRALTTGVMYTVAPGLRTGLEYTHFWDEFNGSNYPAMAAAELATPRNDSGDVFLVRAAVSF